MIKTYSPDVEVEFSPVLLSIPADSSKKVFHVEQSQMGIVPVGGQFGHLKIIREAPSIKNSVGSRMRVVECECICGNVKLYAWNNIQSGSTKSCGCKRYKSPSKNQIKVIPGTRRYYLELVREVPKRDGRRMIEVRCICGKIKFVRLSAFTYGNLKSCGCKREAGVYG